MLPSNLNQEADLPSLAGKRVLVCDDEGIILNTIARTISRAGLQVVGMVNNGQDAVEIAMRERPDLILLDLRMPGLTGLEAAQRILSVYSPCVVLITASCEPEYQMMALELGIHGYIHKPVSTMTLLPMVQSAWEAYYQRQIQANQHTEMNQ